MAEINHQSNQGKVDTGQELSPDGIPLQQAAAPQAAPRISTTPTTSSDDSIMEKLPKADVTPSDNTPAPTDEKVIDFKDFLTAKGDETPEVKPVAAELKKDKLEVTPTVDPATVKPTPDATQHGARDYTGFDDEEAKLLRSMSNESFNRFKPQLLEHKRIKTEYDAAKAAQAELTELKTKGPRIPDNIYEHPQGFLVTPEFQSQQSNATTANAIAEHWKNELTKVNGGAAEYQSLKFNEQGNLVLGEKVKAGPEAMATVLGFVQGAQNQLAKEVGKLESIVQTHQSKYQESQSWINQFNNQHFGMFEQPEYKEQAKPYIKQVIESFHPALRNNPLAVPFAKALITVSWFQQQNAKLASGNGQQVAPQHQQTQQQQVKQQQQRKAGPTASDTGGDSTGGSNASEVSFDDFQRVKNGE